LAFLDIQYLTTEFGLAKDVLDQCSKGGFLYFHAFLCRNECLGPKKNEKVTKKGMTFCSQNMGIKTSKMFR
jgi:hypothetical protein